MFSCTDSWMFLCLRKTISKNDKLLYTLHKLTVSKFDKLVCRYKHKTTKKNMGLGYILCVFGNHWNHILKKRNGKTQNHKWTRVEWNDPRYHDGLTTSEGQKIQIIHDIIHLTWVDMLGVVFKVFFCAKCNELVPRRFDHFWSPKTGLKITINEII